MNAVITFEGKDFHTAPGETILDCLEREGQKIPASCRGGVCQSCIMRVTQGPIPPKSQDGLSDALKGQNHFLSCIACPQESLTCERAHVVEFQGKVSIEAIERLSNDVVAVRFSRPSGFRFSPGQFVTLERGDKLARSYSIASREDELSHIDIHVQRVPEGRMSTWFHTEAKPGDALQMEGAKGSCIHTGAIHEHLLLAGTGTGLAPLYCIAESALRRGHEGSITLMHGAVSQDRLYFTDECQQLATKYPNFTYEQCVLKGEPATGVIVGNLKEALIAKTQTIKSPRVFLCGDPNLVGEIKRELFLSGLSLRRIHVDPFIGTNIRADPIEIQKTPVAYPTSV